jgi:tol-pal system protein YbgF
MMRRATFVPVLAFLLAVLTGPVFAQDRQQTLADIRQELNVLYVSIQRLKRELSTTGAPSTGGVQGGTVLDRVNAMEAELQRLTSQTEELQFRVQQVVDDGTNRIGDLEFRLVELEGGDVSTLGETTTLGGDVTAPAGGTLGVPAQPAAPDQQLAVGEETDFQTAMQALDEGRAAEAADLFARFNQTYPGSPLAAAASLRRGQALNQTGDIREAARAFLDSYSVAPDGPVASEAVLALGTALGKLGKTDEACVTLGEVAGRYPGSQAVAAAQQEMAALGCG